jgi:hypothetical protein
LSSKVQMNTKVRSHLLSVQSTPTYNPNMLEFATYRNSITDGAPQHDADVLWDENRHYLFISSTMRDRFAYPDPAYFKIPLFDNFQDVVSVELAAGVLPNQGNISGDGYVLLDVPELNHILGADGSRYFGILGLTYHPSPTKSFYNLDKSNTDDMPVVFRPPKRRLESLTLILKHPDGSAVSFGAEDPTQPADFNLQSQFTFLITTKTRRRIGLDRDDRAPIFNMH